MKKSLIALAVLGSFAGAASAQITLYGALDANYGNFETERVGGINPGTSEFTGLQDGDAVTDPSRWGIKVSADLGNGLKGLAHVESAIDITTGNAGNPDEITGLGQDANNNLFHRRAVVGLAGGFGTVLLGRAETPIHGVLDDTGPYGAAGFDTSMDTFNFGGVEDGLEIGYGAAPGGIRRSNSINYISPDFAGFNAKLQFANQDEEEGGVATEGKAFGAAVAYENGPMMLAAGYDRYESTDAGVEGPEHTSWLVGGTYDFNMAQLFAQYGNFERDAVGATDEAQQLNIGTKVPMGAFTVLASVGRTEAEVGAADYSGTNYVLGVNYNLAKTTYLYARAGQVANLEADAGGFETDTRGYAIGLRHAF
jgi:predicted porin